MIRLLLLITCPIIHSSSQNNFNSQGEKQGEWSGYHENGKIKYQGQFVNDKEVGMFQYYDYDGNLVIQLDYIEPGVKSQAILYYSSGPIKSEGEYVNQQKHGKWIYYTQQGQIIATEHYLDGMLSGESIYYYDNGRISEKYHYVNNIKTGVSEIFYPSGFLNMRCYYLNNTLHDIAEYYYDNSNQLESIGKYFMGVKDSVWVFYNEFGDTLNIVDYRNSLD